MERIENNKNEGEGRKNKGYMERIIEKREDEGRIKSA